MKATASLALLTPANVCMIPDVVSFGDVPSVELHWLKCLECHSELDRRRHKLYLKSSNLLRSTKKGLVIDTRNTLETVTRTGGEGSFERSCSSYAEPRNANAVKVRLPQGDAFSWTKLISDYIKSGQSRQALNVYKKMLESGVTPSSYTFVAVLKACSNLQDLGSVKQVHSDLLKTGFESHIYVGTMLVDVYAKCGSLVDARHVFEEMPIRNVVSWTAMILGHAQMEEGDVALQLYRRMQQEGVAPNDRTFVGVLKACSSLASCQPGNGDDSKILNKQCLEQVRSIHSDLLTGKFESDVFVGTMLVDVYAKCGSLVDARRVFESLPCRNVVCWTAMILGYAQMEKGEEALQLYARMQQEGFAPNNRTYVGALKACSSLATLEDWDKGDRLKTWCLKQVRAIHSDISNKDLETDLYVGTMLVDVYAKCGSLLDARRVFEKMPDRNVVCWTAMILGYAQMEEGEEALHLYAQMQQEGVAPDDRTFLGALKACGNVAGLQKGKEIHLQILEAGIGVRDLFVANSLIDMYSKCGSLQEAQQVFDAMPERDIVSWSALVAGYARQGDSQTVFQLFDDMRQQGVQPNGVTFLSVLTVCSHEGLVAKGQRYFEAMSRDFGIPPTIDHYNCMVDLLGRAGQVHNALTMAKSMPFQPDSAVWETVLSACQKWGNVELGKQAFEHALMVGRNDAAAHVLMANIYSSANMWMEADAIQAKRVKAGAWKQPGQSSWTDTSGFAHAFVVGDQEHPEIHDIHAKLTDLCAKMCEQGLCKEVQIHVV